MGGALSRRCRSRPTRAARARPRRPPAPGRRRAGARRAWRPAAAAGGAPTAARASRARPARPDRAHPEQRRLQADCVGDRPGHRHPQRHEAHRDAEVVGADARHAPARGTCSWMLRSHRVKKSATQMPASSSSAAIPAVPRPEPMIAACVLAPTRARAAMKTGRRSGRRSATTLPSTPPIAEAGDDGRPARRAVELAARPAPGRGRTPTAARRRGRRTSRSGPRQPCARAHLVPAGAQPGEEALVLRGGRAAAGARLGSAPVRMRARHSALTANVAASTAIASPEPAETTSTPGDHRAGHARRCCASEPAARWPPAGASALTVCGIRPDHRGHEERAAAVP